MDMKSIPFYRFNTVIVGSGAAGLNAALRLYEMGQRDIAIVTEGLKMGTSRNTGSDKQTYYKLTLGGGEGDSILGMAKTLFEGGCVDGDIAYAEAAGSVRSFFHLVELGVPFPTNASGEYVGYKTDHDPKCRGTSAGPYTSRYMTEALERQVVADGIPIFDRHLAVRLLTDAQGRNARGVIALNQAELGDPEKRFTVFAATNVVWATGGEAGMYKSSAYPYSQSGSTGVLFEAGAAGKNLTESQYGIASTKFRWNLSGSFQQCIPRYVSVNEDGTDEREFLAEAFSSREKLLSAIFLKGYQWPFDPRKIEGEGSSYVDVLLYQEEVIRGRKVYLDFTRNPAALEVDGRPDFGLLCDEARSYLTNCGALGQTPYERLGRINPAAIKVYLDHGIDLASERLAISLCAQHNNGGISGNAWWESELRHLFPVGEVNGSHGVYRPGGTALNAGQVGGLRAAQYILRHYMEAPPERERFLAEQAADIEAASRFAQEAACARGEPLDVKREIELLRERMTRYGACIRSKEGVGTAIAQNRAQRERILAGHALGNLRSLTELFRLMDLITAQYVYLSAIENSIDRLGVSRSSYLVYNQKGRLPHDGMNECFRSVTDAPDMESIQEIVFDRRTQSCHSTWRPVRPIPQSEQWFETAWRQFRTGEAFD